MFVLSYLRKLFVAIWIGKIVFFASSVAPLVFRVLSRDNAAALQGQIFPRYFGIGLVVALGVLSISLVYFLRDRKSKRALVLVAISLVAAGLYAHLLYGLTPEILRLQAEVISLPRGSEAPAALEFARLHSTSTTLNAVVLVLALLSLALV